MSNVAKLKKQAAEFEQKRQFDKALAVYVKLLDSFDQNADELDVALFNRVGDILLRQGNVADAVDYYERAVDRYADTGFFNNAIALCNKILRHSPGRASVYYKLGKISAQKGLKHDARTNFLEYADRVQKAGKLDEAFRALKEFADLCPDQDDFRLVLADQLAKAGRKDDAIEQLQVLHERYDAAGRADDASGVANRLHALNPEIQPRGAATPIRARKSAELVFLDLDSPSPALIEPTTSYQPLVSRQEANPVVERVVESLELTATPSTPSAAIEQIVVHGPDLDVSRLGDDTIGLERTPAEPLFGLEQTSLDDREPTGLTPATALLGFESTALATPAGQDTVDDSESIDIDLDEMPSGDADEDPRLSPSRSFGALEGLPVVDVDAPAPRAADRRTPVGVTTATPPSDNTLLIDLEVDESVDDAAERATPAVSRHSALIAQNAVDALTASVEADPDNWELRRELAEAMFEAGDRAGGIRELETSMTGAEKAGKLELASALAEEIARLEPGTVKHQQKRVEYAFRTNDRARLIDAYLALADVLLRSEQADKARSIYQRVLNLAPDEPRARVALETIEPTMNPASTSTYTPPTPSSDGVPRHASPSPPPPGKNDFVNLGDWLRDAEQPKDTRMVVPEHEPTGDEDADFADMLRKFKQGVAENVDVDDYQSHYDLAIAFREMGLIDEAIGEFQKALGSPSNRLATFEALGQCFMDKGQFKLASSILGRALNERASEDQLVGVLYLLGVAAETQGNMTDALGYYQRVFVVDIQFRDVSDRMRALEQGAQ